MALGPETAKNAIDIEECIARLSVPARKALAGIAGLSPNARVPEIADGIRTRLDDGRLRRHIGEIEVMVIRYMADHGGVVNQEWAVGHFRKTASDSVRRLLSLGLIGIDAEGNLRLALEILLAGRDWYAPAGTLLAPLQRLPLQDLEALGKAVELHTPPLRLTAAAALYRRFCDGWPDSLASLGEEEAALLLALAARGFSGSFLSGPDPIGRAIEALVAARGSWARLVHGGPEAPIRHLASRALIVPGGLQGLNRASLWIPAEARGLVGAWRRERIRRSRRPEGRGEAEIRLDPPRASAIEFFKRIIVECLTHRIRVTHGHSIHTSDWNRVLKAWGEDLSETIGGAFGALVRLGLLNIRPAEEGRGRVLRPTAAAEGLLPLQGRDRDRFVWARLEDEPSLWVHRADESGAPIPDGEAIASPADVLRFLREDRFFSVQEIDEAFECSHIWFFRDPIRELLEIFYRMGWTCRGHGGSEPLYRRTPLGSEIAAEDPRPVAPPARPENPLIVQPNGRIIADPATPMGAIEDLGRIGDIVSIDPAYCFQIEPGKLRRAISVRRPEGGARAFLERHASLPIPKTVRQLLDDVERSVVEVDLARAGAIVSARSPEDAARVARSKALRGQIAGVAGRFIILPPTASVTRFAEMLRREGFLPTVLDAESFCRKRREEMDAEAPAAPAAASAPPPPSPSPEEDPGTVLARAARTGEPVEIIYRPPGRGAPGPRPLSAVVERIHGRRVIVREASGRSRVLQLGRVVRVSSNGKGKRP